MQFLILFLLSFKKHPRSVTFLREIIKELMQLNVPSKFGSKQVPNDFFLRKSLFVEIS